MLATLSSDLNEEEFAALDQMQTDFVHQHMIWEGRIEVAYLSITALKTYKLHTSKIAVISPGEPFHIKDAGDDWLINWHTVREKGIALFGPSPKTLIDPISELEYKHAVKEHMQMWREWVKQTHHTRGPQAYAILTMCRALYTLKMGELVSKKQAALWAMKEMPEWSDLIQNALMWRIKWREKHIDHDAKLSETVRFVNFAIERSERSF